VERGGAEGSLRSRAARAARFAQARRPRLTQARRRESAARPRSRGGSAPVPRAASRSLSSCRRKPRLPSSPHPLSLFLSLSSSFLSLSFSLSLSLSHYLEGEHQALRRRILLAGRLGRRERERERLREDERDRDDAVERGRLPAERRDAVDPREAELRVAVGGVVVVGGGARSRSRGGRRGTRDVEWWVR
jgi:hypothetical protein